MVENGAECRCDGKSHEDDLLRRWTEWPALEKHLSSDWRQQDPYPCFVVSSTHATRRGHQHEQLCLTHIPELEILQHSAYRDVTPPYAIAGMPRSRVARAKPFDRASDPCFPSYRRDDESGL